MGIQHKKVSLSVCLSVWRVTGVNDYSTYWIDIRSPTINPDGYPTQEGKSVCLSVWRVTGVNNYSTYWTDNRSATINPDGYPTQEGKQKATIDVI